MSISIYRMMYCALHCMRFDGFPPFSFLGHDQKLVGTAYYLRVIRMKSDLTERRKTEGLPQKRRRGRGRRALCLQGWVASSSDDKRPWRGVIGPLDRSLADWGSSTTSGPKTGGPSLYPDCRQSGTSRRPHRGSSARVLEGRRGLLQRSGGLETASSVREKRSHRPP